MNSVSYIEECNDLSSKALRAAMVKVPLNACDRNWVEGGVVEHGGTPTPGEWPHRQNMTQHFNAHLNHV